jgi:hypothetical protein
MLGPVAAGAFIVIARESVATERRVLGGERGQPRQGERSRCGVDVGVVAQDVRRDVPELLPRLNDELGALGEADAKAVCTSASKCSRSFMRVLSIVSVI